MARPRKDPLIVIDLKSDSLRFPGRFDLEKTINRYLDYYKTSRKCPPNYIPLKKEDIDIAREAALSRKKKGAAPSVSFSFDGIPLVAFNPIKKEV